MFNFIKPRRRPGQNMTDYVYRLLKVNHAGEHGAVHIYAGQIMAARLTAPDLLPELCKFKSHEEKHRALFAEALATRQLCRCRSYHLCAAGGFVLGLVTGLFGRHAIAATTVAVECVVLRHLWQQLAYLDGVDKAAYQTVASIVAEEQLHHDQSASHLVASSFASSLLQSTVSVMTEAVIWSGMRI